MKSHSFLAKLTENWSPKHWLEHRTVVAVSGGPDSVALLAGLREIASRKENSIFVAHFNHGWRGTDSQEDEHFLRELANRWQLPILLGKAAKTAGKNSNQGCGAESIARDERHAFLQSAAQQVGARYIATGHTADDQVETVLHRIFRGTGISGLSGIRQLRYLGDGLTLVRPMLTIRRACVLSFLESIQQPFRIDATNQDPAFTRNMIRHEVLPLLEAKFGEQLTGNILKLAEQAAAAQQVIDEQVSELYERHVQIDVNHSARIIISTRLHQQPIHLVRELFKRVWQQQNWPLREMDFARWHQLAELIVQGSPFSPLSMPGNIRVEFQDEARIRLSR